MKRTCWIPIILICMLLIAACDAALTVGSKTIGVSSGNFVYTDGYLESSYNYPLDKVWMACVQTLTDIKATAIEKERKIASGKITAVAYDEKILILVEYTLKNQTSVSVRVGLSGNTMASQLIHDKIANNLLKSVSENPKSTIK